MKPRTLIAAVAAAAVASFVAYTQYAENEERKVREAARTEAAQAWADMQQCLLGAKLAEVPSVAARVRRIELAGNDPARGPWPRACAPHVSTLYQRLDASFGAALKEELRQRFACDTHCDPDDPGVQLHGLASFAAAEAALVVVPPQVAAPAMVTDTFITKADVSQLAPEDARIRDRDYLADGRARYLFQSGKGLSHCELSPDEEPGLACGELALQIAPASARLLPGADATLIRSGAEVYDTTGAKVRLHGGVRAGFVARHMAGRRYRIAHVVDGEPQHTATIEMPGSSSVPVLIDDLFFYVAPDRVDERALHVRKLHLEGGKIVHQPKRVGPSVAMRGAPSVCRSGDSQVLLFGRSVSDWTLVFAGDGGVSAPVAVADAAKKKQEPAPEPKLPPKPIDKSTARDKALADAAEFGMNSLDLEGKPVELDPLWGRVQHKKKPGDEEQQMWGDQLGGGERPRRAPLPRFAFTCDAGTATLSWRTPKKDAELIHRVRCTASGCDHDEVELAGIDVKTWWTAAAFGDRMLLVWRDGLGLLRRRVAPFDELAGAADAIVMDTAERGGPMTRDLEAIYGRNAVVFVFRGTGFHALRFDDEGVATAL